MTTEIIADKHLIPWYRRPLPFGMFYLLLQPVALIIMLTGPNYYRVKGGYTRWGKGLKTFLFVLGFIGFLFGLALTIGDASKQTASTVSDRPPAVTGGEPNMQVQKFAYGNEQAIKVTSDDDQLFQVERIVANGRADEEGCDSLLKNGDHPPVQPGELKRGDAFQFVVACGDSIMSADIYTDRGKVSFKFELSGN